MDDFRFEETKDGYKLRVEPVSFGTNEDNPVKREFLKKLEELTKLPFVLRLNEDAEITELEGSDEYWSKITDALRSGLATLEPKPAGHGKMIEAVVGLYTDMPAEVRLAKLTESVQPLVEFAWTETTVGKPVLTDIEGMSPLGPVRQEVAITLNRVSDGFAHFTIRSSIPKAEMKKLTAAMLDRLNNGALKPEEVAKAKAELAAVKDFNAETVAQYKVGLEDGMLETFHATQTVTATENDKPKRRTKTRSLQRMD